MTSDSYNDSIDSKFFQDFIQLKKLPKGSLDPKEQPIGFEPRIPFRLVNGSTFTTTESFDFVFLAQSPAYTPRTADILLDTFREFIDESLER